MRGGFSRSLSNSLTAVTAYPLDRIGDAAVNDQVGRLPVVIFTRDNSRAVGAFSRVVEGQTLTFAYRNDDQTFIDEQNGSI